MTTDASGAPVVTREIHIEAPPERVFAFFTDPEKMLRWKGLAADLDAREGGRYRVHMHGDLTAVGEYIAIEPFRRIVISWGWEGEGTIVPPGSSTVEVTFEAERGGTRLRLVHRDLPAEAAEQHNEGWAHYLARLEIAAAGGDAGPDPWAVSAAEPAAESAD